MLEEARRAGIEDLDLFCVKVIEELRRREGVGRLIDELADFDYQLWQYERSERARNRGPAAEDDDLS